MTMIPVNLTFKLTKSKEMQSKQGKNALFFSCHKIGSNSNQTVSYPNEINSESYRIRYDVIYHNRNRYNHNRTQS